MASRGKQKGREEGRKESRKKGVFGAYAGAAIYILSYDPREITLICLSTCVYTYMGVHVNAHADIFKHVYFCINISFFFLQSISVSRTLRTHRSHTEYIIPNILDKSHMLLTWRWQWHWRTFVYSLLLHYSKARQSRCLVWGAREA